MSSLHLSAGSSVPPREPGKIRLYSMKYCPYAQRIHLVLDAKQIPYETVYINLTEKPEWYFNKNPLGLVPCLELIDGDVLWESLIVAEYLDEAYPDKKLYPDDPLAKAKDKMLMDRFNSFVSTMYKMYLATASEGDKVFQQVLDKLEVFEVELKKRGTPYFCGDSPGMLDLMMWPWCERAEVLRILRGELFSLPVVRFTGLLKWKTTMKENPVVRKSYLSPEEHAKFIKYRLAGTPKYDFDD